ncbi:MAG: leucine-rich repeat protein [Clostridia bacterium]|nr:leucine-rich repeat protein [Clostridia bacterium]
MKKKLLLIVAMAALMVVVLALSVSAVTGSASNEYGSVTEVSGMESLAKTYSDHDSRVVLKNADGTFTTYPSYYIYNGSTGSGMRINMTTLNTALALSDAEKYTSASVVRVEVFADARLDHLYEGCTSLIDVYLPDGVWLHYASFSGCSSLTTITLPNSCTTIPTSCFYGCTSLETVVFPSTLTGLGNRAFQNCISLKRADLPSGVTSIPQDCFHACSNLEYLKVPSSCKTIANYVTNGCSNVLWDLSEATSLESIGSNNSYGVTTSLVFPEGFKTISGVNSSKITELVFPNSTTSIGVIKCSSLEEFVIPESVTSLGSKAFDYSTSLKKITVPKGLTSIVTTGNTSFFGTTGITEIVYTGNEGDAVLADILTLLTKATVTYANHCEVYNEGNHKLDGELSKGFVGEMYLSKYVEECVCGNGCGKTITVNEAAPLFVNLGFSASLYGEGEMSVNYKVDAQAIASYESLTGEKINYGVFAVLAEKIGENDIFDAEGNALSGVIAADITDAGFNLFSLKIKGFNETQKDTDLAMGAFIGITKDESTEYAYLQIEAPAENAKYFFASYNDVLTMVPSDEDNV